MLNHLFVVSAGLSKEGPEVVRAIYNALLGSNGAMGGRSDPDMPPLGHDKVRHGGMRHRLRAREQLIPRRLAYEEPFDGTTITF